MRDRWLIAGGGAVALLLAGLLAYVTVFPHWAAAALGELARQHLGRSFEAGGTHLDFSPLAIRIDHPRLSAGGEAGESLVSATSLIIPVTFNQLLSRQPGLSTLTLEEAEIALLIDERGEASWDFAGAAVAGPAKILLERATVRFFDARNGQSLSLAAVTGLLELRADGGLAFNGSAVINSQLVRIDADLKSLSRVNGDGSPLDVVLSADVGAASFSGRLSTDRALSLAGPVSLSGTASPELMRFLGLPATAAAGGSVPLAIDAGLDSAGRAYALRKAVLTLGQFRGAGDITLDLRDERPMLQVNLKSSALSLESLIPASGAAAGEWGRQPISFGVLNGFDAEIALLAEKLSYRGFTATGAQLALSLKDGNLSTFGVAQPAGGGAVRFTFDAASVTLPPRLSLSIAAENVSAQPLLAALTGIGEISGSGSFSAELSAEGTTQEEMIGTLRGKARLALADGAIAKIDLPGLFAAVREKILDGWPDAAGAAAFKSLSAEVAIADGEAGIKTLNMVSAERDVSVTGAVDLLRRALGVSVVAFQGNEPVLPVPVVIDGFWNKPRIYPDVLDILKDPAAGFARLKELSPAPGN
ncbi:MAG: AsmA family protein [Aestuariivirga sp.]|uniref:AsmA family protein n=1 Tax=Aestuariivirga sp. TaxID=2650926 RepID=UPI0038D15206